MPHIVVDLSAELDASPAAARLLGVLHDAAAATGIMNPADLKLRTRPCSRHLVGGTVRPFAHVSAYLLEGRSAATKRTLSDALLEALEEAFPTVERLSVDVRDMADASYRKRPFHDADGRDRPHEHLYDDGISG